VLRGERVRLRALEPDDAPEVWRWHQDHEFSVLDGNIYPESLITTTDWIRSLGQPTFNKVYFGIEKEDGTLIGSISLRRTEPADRSAEFGIAIAREWWNQGYGTDATRTILRFAFTDMNLHRVMLRVTDYNRRAQHVYERCGFRVEGRLREARWHDGRWHDKIVMGILAHEFEDIPSYQ
jgi:RimJ/RimL family protein N-acetyltransferase